MGNGDEHPADVALEDPTPVAPPSLSRSRAPLSAALGWGAVWLLLRITGQSYSLRVLYAGYQFLPYEALKSNPFRAVLHLHIQPPMWNFIVGIVANTPWLSDSASFQALSLLTGMLLAGLVCAALIHIGARPRTSIALTAVATLNSALLSHAFEPRYDLFTAMLIAALVWSVARLRQHTGRLSIAAPLAIACVLTMTRAIFHPLWLFGFAVVLTVVLRKRLPIRRTVVVLIVALMTVGGWMAKNEIMYGRFTLSTWTGMNLLRSTLPAFNPATVESLRENGAVSVAAAVPPFSAYETYSREGWDRPCTASGSEADATSTRDFPEAFRTGPFDNAAPPNYNYRCFIPIYGQAGSDFRALVRAQPLTWAKARLWALNNWFEVPEPKGSARSPLWHPLYRVSQVMLVTIPHPTLPRSWQTNPIWVHQLPLSIVLLALTVALVLATATSRRRRDGLQLVLATTTSLVIWSFVSGVFGELGEQSRFRNAIDPITIAIGGFVVLRLFSHRPTNTSVPIEAPTT